MEGSNFFESPPVSLLNSMFIFYSYACLIFGLIFLSFGIDKL